MKQKNIVIVTGVGLKECKRVFKQPDPATLIEHEGSKYKMNAAAGAAVELSRSGHTVYMVGDCKGCMKLVGEKFMKMPYHIKQADLQKKTDSDEVAREVEKIKNESKMDVHLVYYAGVSGKNIQLPKDTVALDPWEVPPESIGPIIEANTVSAFNIIQSLKNVFHSQKVSKIVFITAISSIRTKRLHSLDAMQKSAVHALARSFALDLTKEGIYITEIMPGITDTGFYDPKITFDAMIQASKEFGYEYTEDTYPVFKAERVGEAVVFAIESNFNVRELILMPYGQYPHLGA